MRALPVILGDRVDDPRDSDDSIGPFDVVNCRRNVHTYSVRSVTIDCRLAMRLSPLQPAMGSRVSQCQRNSHLQVSVQIKKKITPKKSINKSGPSCFRLSRPSCFRSVWLAGSVCSLYCGNPKRPDPFPPSGPNTPVQISRICRPMLQIVS